MCLLKWIENLIKFPTRGKKVGYKIYFFTLILSKNQCFGSYVSSFVIWIIEKNKHRNIRVIENADI